MEIAESMYPNVDAPEADSPDDIPPMLPDVNDVTILFGMVSDSLAGVDAQTDHPTAMAVINTVQTALTDADNILVRLHDTATVWMDKMTHEQRMADVQDEAVRAADDMPTAVRDEILSELSFKKHITGCKITYLQRIMRSISSLRSCHGILTDCVADVVEEFDEGLVHDAVGGVQRELDALSI